MEIANKDNKSPILYISREKVRSNWKKSDEDVMECFNSIRGWMKTEYLPEVPTDSMLEFFITNCKYDLEKTKINILAYYSIRKKVPELYHKSNPFSPEMQDVWDMGVYCPLPQPLDGLYRVSIVKIYPYTPKFVCCKHFANCLNIYEVRICEDLSLGEIIIVDYEHLSWSHVIRMTPSLLHKVSIVFENVAKSRVKQIHIIQAPSYVYLLINVFKKFLKKKVADRILVHKNLDTLFKNVPKKFLPKDYGGNEMSLNELTELWKKQLEKYRERFDMLEKLEGY